MALETLDALLAPSGVLFVGPAEQPLALEHGFVSANYSKAFACRRAGATRHLQEAVEDWRKPSPTPVSFTHVPVSASGAGKALDLARPRRVQSEELPTADLETARQLADAGRLQDAACNL